MDCRHIPVLLALAASLASCVLAPHVEYLRPAVSGLVLEDGKPIPGVELYLGKYPGNNQPCTEVGEPVPVAPDGAFSWAAIEQRKLTDSMLNPVKLRGAISALCIRHPDKGALIGAMLYIRQDQPASLRLVCDVARPAGGFAGSGPYIMRAWLGQHHYCTSSAAG